MSAKYLKIIKEAALVASNKDPDDVQDRQRQKAKTDKLANKKITSSVPKNNDMVFSPKPEPNRGAGTDRHPNVPRAKSTKPTYEEVAVNSIGGGGVSTLTNPSDNFSFQVDQQRKKHLKQIKTNMVRRKKPIGEEFSAGIGNTQVPAGSKKTPTTSAKPSSTKEKVIYKGKKAAISPSKSSNAVDTQPPIGGGQ